jgi:SpoIID/LytB domain protein
MAHALRRSRRPNLINATYHRSGSLQEPSRNLLGVLALALVALALSAPSALASTESLVIAGAGDGHGVGMSQEGALGYAEHGASYEQILAHYYTGTTLGQAPAGRTVKVLVGSRVKTLPLETYVRGVVAAEMPSSWPLAALETQAVASRTYALTSDAGGQKFDVYADTRSQMYEGPAAETASSNAAIADTAGQIVTYEGKPVTTYFFASSGGMTESIQNSFLGATPEPWLIGVADPYDQGPLHTWKVTLSFATVTSRLRGLLKGSFRGIEVLKRGVSPRIVSAYIVGSRGRTLTSGPELAARLGLDSTWEYFSVIRGTSVKREPEGSGRTPPATPPAAASPKESPPATSPQGGAPAPSAASAASTAQTGGVSAE